MLNAATISGDVTNACVFGFPSFLFAKFLLKEVTIEFARSGSLLSRFHCPIHGPQAFAIMVAPTSSKAGSMPSLSAV